MLREAKNSSVPKLDWIRMFETLNETLITIQFT